MIGFNCKEPEICIEELGTSGERSLPFLPNDIVASGISHINRQLEVGSRLPFLEESNYILVSIKQFDRYEKDRDSRLPDMSRIASFIASALKILF